MGMETKKRVWRVVLVTLGLAALVAVLALLVLNGFSVGCVFKRFTGLLCPGCGNTRATFALFRLDFMGMLRYNLLYPLEMLYLARIYFVCAKNYMKNGKVSYPVRPDAVDIICLVCIAVWWIVRNVIPIFA